MSKKPKSEKRIKGKKSHNPEVVKTMISCLTAIICTIMLSQSFLIAANKICEAKTATGDKTYSDNVIADDEFFSSEENASTENSESTAPDEQTADESAGESSGVQSADSSAGNSGSDNDSNNSNQTAQKGEGLNSTDKAEVLGFYKAAAKATGNNITVTRKKTLTRLDGGSGTAGSIISRLESAGKKALANNSGTDKGFRGTPELMTADDITSATASVNGNYTNVMLKIKDYTALPTGKANEGSVGHAIGVLNTIDEALKELPLTVDDPSNIRLVYTGASITAKIDNKTNKIESAKWVYDVTIKINNTKAKAFGIPFTLDGAEFAIHYEASF